MEKRKTVKWFEWMYEVSDFWRVKSLERKRKIKKWYRVVKEKILKQGNGNHWYKTVTLSSIDKQITFTVHRIVAKAFIINKGNKSQVNHIDWDKKNNKLENLEWVTEKENKKHSFHVLKNNHILAYAWQPKWKWHPRTKLIAQLKEWEIVWKFWWCREASRKTWVHRDSINHCLHWRHKTAWWFQRRLCI